jgi:hypothetical protein
MDVNNLHSDSLNVGSYSDGDLCGLFKIPQNYTIQQLEDATSGLQQVIFNSLGIHNRNEIIVFINESKSRLANKLQNNNSTPNPSQISFNANTYGNATGVVYKQRTNKRVILIDSQYRQNVLDSSDKPPGFNDREFNTDYILDLSEPLVDVTSIKLNTVSIPTTWYAFDHHLGNTGFARSNAAPDCINIQPGNYDLSGLTQAISKVDSTLQFEIEAHTNIVSLKNDGGAAADSSFVYYKEGGLTDCSKTCVGGSYVNQNLGWNLGFRQVDSSGELSSIPLSTTFTKADVPSDTYGPKYFMLEINDYNQSHINSGIVSITDRSTRVTAINTRANKGKYGEKLTKAQLYTQNALITDSGGKPDTSNRVYGTTSKDVLGIIPLLGLKKLRPEPLIDDYSDINVPRIYSGPVKIDKLRIRLIDDKGNLVNLHDNDWSFTLVVEQLY